jgi:hypothetical protein
MRLLVLLLFSAFSLIAAGQRKYHCEYKETVSFPMPDSISKSVRKQIEDQGFSSKIADQLVQQMNLQGLSADYVRIVEARADSTFILATNKVDQEEESDIKINMPDAKYLYKKGKVYVFDTLKRQWVISVMWSGSKTFNANDDKRLIMGHSCTCYASTDSTLKIWVAKDLPGYVNPGLSIGQIKGAVLGYELNNRDKNNTIKSEMTKIE